MKLKKFASAGLAALLILICAACAGQSNGGKPSSGNGEGAYGVKGSVLFDRDGITVTTTGWTTDPTDANAYPVIGLDIQNNGEKDLCLGVTDGIVNGFMNQLNLIELYQEDGQYYGANYAFSLTIPAGGSGEYLLGVNQWTLALSGGVIGEIQMAFTLAEDEFTVPYYTADPVTLVTENEPEAVDLDAVGTVAADTDQVKIVFAGQDYDTYFGPTVTVYVENKTNQRIGLAAEAADADGVECDSIYYSAALAPGARSVEEMCFDGPLRELKGIENLTVQFRLTEGVELENLMEEGTLLDPVSVTYPPQVWGEYENGGLRLEIQPRYNNLLTVETPENDPDGVLFSISETASREAAGGYDGAGALVDIRKVSGDTLHELLCEDMSGVSVFAKDADGNACLACYPTDVRYERSTVEEMAADAEQWTMLTEWAGNVPEQLRDQNEGLEIFYRGNTALDMYLARALWQDGTAYSISGTEYGVLTPDGVDGTPYGEYLLDGGFFETERDEAPDGESIVLLFPEDDVRFEFFLSEGSLVRETSGEDVTYFETFLYDENVSFANVMRGWYYALAERAGAREPDALTASFAGTWAEKIAGRGEIVLTPTLAPGVLKAEAHWPNSASEMVSWEMTACLTEDGAFRYTDGTRTVTAFDEDGTDYITDESGEQSGAFTLSDEGELRWHDDQAERDEDSVFIRSD